MWNARNFIGVRCDEERLPGKHEYIQGICRPALIAVAGVAILLSGCSQGASQSDGDQAKPVVTQTQAPIKTQATQASPAADAQKLKDDAAKAAKAKTVAAKAAAAKAAAAKAAALEAAKAKTAIKWCNEQVSAGPDTPCAFAKNVFKGMINARWDRKTDQARFNVYNPVKGISYMMTCKLGVAILCSGGTSDVVYLQGSNPGEDQYFG